MDDMHIPEMRPGYDPVPPRFEMGATATAAAATAVPASVPHTDDIGALAAIDGPGVIVVAPGKGLADVFRSLGAHVIVSGGQTMNPSTQDLYQAIAKLPTEQVIILPNNGNILMAAQQAQALATGKSVAVVPSKSVPQGISALLALTSPRRPGTQRPCHDRGARKRANGRGHHRRPRCPLRRHRGALRRRDRAAER